jgi:uncharacterized protein
MTQSITDAAWWAGDQRRTPQKRFGGMRRNSYLVPMSDGTRIAAHVFLPEGLRADVRLPTVMSITPYFSVMEYRHPLAEKIVGKLAIVGGAEFAAAITSYGYANVLVDARGSGASFGQKDALMLRSVVDDGAQVIDWIVRQPWSNGLVGATGISAVGMTAQWLTLAKHDALRAIIPRFTIFDMYGGTHPGGLTPATFVGDVGRILRMMDANRPADMPENAVARAVMRSLVRGLQPVDEDPDRRLLAEAAADHAKNTYFDPDLVAITYRDDEMPSTPGAVVDDQGPRTYAADMTASDVPIYGFAGWGDGSFIREMISLHNTVRTPGSRLVIGPWPHGGRWYASPLVQKKRRTDFDHVAEMVRFFDLHLRDTDHGVADEAAIHYFTTGEERWKETDRWPVPAQSDVKTLHLGSGNRLAPETSETEAGDAYTVDMSATTGPHSRYGKHLAGGRYPVTWPDRTARDKRLLVYDSEPLGADLEVTGHPQVTLHVSSTREDGAVFVYLEDVGPTGQVLHVTDGLLRASRRRITPGDPPFWMAGPWRAGTGAEEELLRRGEVVELEIELYPVSHLFRRGHAIRLAMAGADADTVLPVPAGGPAPVLDVRHGGRSASRVELPVMA